MYVDVDAIKDPNPDKAAKAYPRKRPTDPETVKEGNPPIGNTLATKLRVWQIVPTVLEANPHWLTNHRILANGIPWGDESDPVLPDSKPNCRRHLKPNQRGPSPLRNLARQQKPQVASVLLWVKMMKIRCLHAPALHKCFFVSFLICTIIIIGRSSGQ